MSAANPVLVEVTRGDWCESRHRGAACIVSASGGPAESWGDVEAAIYPRSSIKPIQALPFIETGSADWIRADDQMLALACASHSAEAAHLDIASRWMAALEVDDSAFACGPHLPLGDRASREMVARGEVPLRRHNNCSGKHLGMISTAKHVGEPVAGYEEPSHPVQQRVREALSELAEFDLTDAPVGIDGCGIPNLAVPLRQVALAFANLADPNGQKQARRDALTRIRGAMTAHPLLVAGADRFDTLVMHALAGSVAIKVGAEAVYAAAIPSLGVGVALKIDDGSRRAAEVAMAALLRYLKIIDDTQWAALADTVCPVVRDTNGRPVGRIRAAEAWLRAADRDHPEKVSGGTP